MPLDLSAHTRSATSMTVILSGTIFTLLAALYAHLQSRIALLVANPLKIADAEKLSKEATPVYCVCMLLFIGSFVFYYAIDKGRYLTRLIVDELSVIVGSAVLVIVSKATQTGFIVWCFGAIGVSLVCWRLFELGSAIWEVKQQRKTAKKAIAAAAKELEAQLRQKTAEAVRLSVEALQKKAKEDFRPQTPTPEVRRAHALKGVESRK